MVGAAYRAYRQIEVTTADPKRLVIMCYEGAIQSLKIAKQKYIAHEYEAKGKAVHKALEIISALREALDFERGGEIARNLDILYSFMAKYILTADQKKDLKALDQVVMMLEEMKSTWDEVFYGHRDEGMAMVPPPEISRSHRGREGQPSSWSP